MMGLVDPIHDVGVVINQLSEIIDDLRAKVKELTTGSVPTTVIEAEMLVVNLAEQLEQAKQELREVG